MNLETKTSWGREAGREGGQGRKRGHCVCGSSQPGGVNVPPGLKVLLLDVQLKWHWERPLGLGAAASWEELQVRPTLFGVHAWPGRQPRTGAQRCRGCPVVSSCVPAQMPRQLASLCVCFCLPGVGLTEAQLPCVQVLSEACVRVVRRAHCVEGDWCRLGSAPRAGSLCADPLLEPQFPNL